MTHECGLVEHYVQQCQGIVLTGGVDPRMESFGVATAPDAQPMDARRQAFDLALLAAMDCHPAMPLLAVCLGMQLLSLHRGGTLNQSLERTHASAQRHVGNRRHPIRVVGAGMLATSMSVAGETVVSNHRQAVEHSGDLRVVAESDDGITEAVEDPERPFYHGVQWHPERGGDGPLSQGLFHRLVMAARSRPPVGGVAGHAT